MARYVSGKRDETPTPPRRPAHRIVRRTVCGRTRRRLPVLSERSCTVLAVLSPEVTYFVETPSPVIALTIHDGPDAQDTSAILDALRAYGARAKFFLIGSRIAGQEALLARMRAEGHELANHGYDDRMSLLVPGSQLSRGIAATHTLLAPFGAVRWLHPVSGFFTAAILALTAERQYGIALGDVFPLDSRISSPRFHRWYILRPARPGSIIILHDAGGRGLRTAAAISRVIPVLGPEASRS